MITLRNLRGRLRLIKYLCYVHIYLLTVLWLNKRNRHTHHPSTIVIMGALLSVPLMAIPSLSGIGGWILSCCGAAAVYLCIYRGLLLVWCSM